MEKKEKKPILKKWWFWLIIILIVIIIVGAQGGNNVQTSTNTDNTNNKPVITWTNHGSDDKNQQLLVAVEPSDSSYEGDTVNAGIYIIRQTNTIYEDQTERIYNIYITDKEPASFDEVSLEKFVGSVGGIQNENELEIEVKKGQFIIFSLVQGGKNGHIEMFKK